MSRNTLKADTTQPFLQSPNFTHIKVSLHWANAKS